MAQPDFVFVGNSMVESRIDIPTLSELTEAKVALLTDGGSSSARWYLYLKNYLVPSGVKPKRVFLFFRDWSLSLPFFRLTGAYRDRTEQAMSKDDRLVRRFMDQADGIGGGSSLEKLLLAVYSVQRWNTAIRESATEDLVKLLSLGDADEDELDDDLEDTFAVKNLRRDLAVDLPDLEEDEEPMFSADPQESFLPHIITLARREAIPLVLVRVKRRPDRDQDSPEQAARLTRYMTELRTYVESNGVPLFDESNDPQIPLDWYADGDHIAEEHMADYTRHFHERARRFFE